MNAPLHRLFAPAVAGVALLLAAAEARAQDPKPAPQAQGIPECKEMKKTASGLEYGFLKKGGDGQPPGPVDEVRVNYTGWLLDGTKFDSSRDSGQPAQFPLNRVIAGWQEALQLMTPGARCKLVIPGDLAYGPQGQPPTIPANATLVFDVELLEVTTRVRVPTMRVGKPEAQTALENGVKWEIVKEGDGPQITTNDGFALRYALWKKSGQILDCSEMHDGARLQGDCGSMPVPLLGDLALKCKLGTVLRAEVPQKVYPGPTEDTVWEIEIVKVLPIPAFRALDKAKTVTTQSGLQYEVLALGEGQSPKASDSVSALYTGWLEDGTRFDSAHARGGPSTFSLQRVIAGWKEGLQLMKPGGKFLFRVPGNLAYAERGFAPKIGPNATLVFLVELVEVNPAPPTRPR